MQASQRAQAGLAAAMLACAAALSGCAASTHLSRADTRRITRRTYVIIGASSGFGRGAAMALGHDHANVVLAARRADLLEEVASQIRTSGGQAPVVPTDIAAPEQVEALADAAVRRFGRIDVWMNIAGVGAVGRFWDVPVADDSRIVDVNLKGVIYGSRAALRRFVAQRSGTLVNMGSVESEVPLAYHATYSATSGNNDCAAVKPPFHRTLRLSTFDIRASGPTPKQASVTASASSSHPRSFACCG